MGTHGKCYFVNTNTNVQCGCLRHSVVKNGDFLCRGCNHGQSYHEELYYPVAWYENQNFAFNNPEGSINFRLLDDSYYTGAENMDIYDILSESSINSRNYPQTLDRGSFNLRNQRKDNRRVAKNRMIFKLYCLPYCYRNLTPKIPRKVNKLINDGGLMKRTCFENDSSYGIKKEVEKLFPSFKNKLWKFFRCTSTSDLEIANEPNIGWNINELKSIAGSRKKLYLGIIDETFLSQQFQQFNQFLWIADHDL